MTRLTHLPYEVGECVPPVEDLPVCVHPGVCCPDLVPLEQVLVWELVRQVVMLEMSHTGAGHHLHGAPAGPHLGSETSFIMGFDSVPESCIVCWSEVITYDTSGLLGFYVYKLHHFAS